MPEEAQWFLYIDFNSFKIVDEEGLCLVTTDKGAFYEYTGFNPNPCHQRTSIEILSVTVNIKESINYEFIDEVPFYCTVYTNKGLWKPPIFSSLRKSALIKIGTVDNTAYKIEEVAL
ncbi:hypothetical protein [Reinekea marinisedimentorum]|uniref:Uncharacterized protein n=1 Tax=Reinekea marinisedimentorum TaxID=230495 RepID=A0A4R3HSK2_9GAMM|nr:hypothetical protein [Reinekea marinisedimentorum]TCS33789.1 hypothetical protein BCF53_1493 [Reinekea marinisedimentorum]